MKDSVQHRSLSETVRSVKALMTFLGMKLTDKVSVTSEALDKVYEVLKSRYKSSTISSLFEKSKSCVSPRRRAIRNEFKKRGKIIPEFDFPEVQKQIAPIYELSDEQRLIIRMKMLSLRASKKLSDRLRFIWMWFALYFGVRPGDIGRLTWGNLYLDKNGRWQFEYVPHKTSKKCKGRTAGRIVPTAWMVEIMPFMGKPNEKVIFYDISKIPQHGVVELKHGDFAAMHRSMRKWMNKFMHEEVGVPKEIVNAAYLFRKECARLLYEEYGEDVENSVLGHSREQMRDHYVNMAHSTRGVI